MISISFLFEKTLENEFQTVEMTPIPINNMTMLTNPHLQIVDIVEKMSLVRRSAVIVVNPIAIAL